MLRAHLVTKALFDKEKFIRQRVAALIFFCYIDWKVLSNTVFVRRIVYGKNYHTDKRDDALRRDQPGKIGLADISR